MNESENKPTPLPRWIKFFLYVFVIPFGFITLFFHSIFGNKNKKFNPYKDFEFTSYHKYPARMIRYIFDGWTDRSIQWQFQNSIDNLATEAIAGRVDLSAPRGMMFIDSRAFGNEEGHGIGNEPGDFLEIMFYPHLTSPEKIEQWLEKTGIKVHRFDPFYRPRKNFWQFLRDMIFRKPPPFSKDDATQYTF